MTCMPTTREGFVAAIGWYCAERIVGNFDRQYAASQARIAADPTYKPDPFGDKPKVRTVFSMDEYCASVKAGVGSKRGMRV